MDCVMGIASVIQRGVGCRVLVVVVVVVAVVIGVAGVASLLNVGERNVGV